MMDGLIGATKGDRGIGFTFPPPGVVATDVGESGFESVMSPPFPPLLPVVVVEL